MEKMKLTFKGVARVLCFGGRDRKTWQENPQRIFIGFERLDAVEYNGENLIDNPDWAESLENDNTDNRAMAFVSPDCKLGWQIPGAYLDHVNSDELLDMNLLSVCGGIENVELPVEFELEDKTGILLLYKDDYDFEGCRNLFIPHMLDIVNARYGQTIWPKMDASVVERLLSKAGYPGRQDLLYNEEMNDELQCEYNEMDD